MSDLHVFGVRHHGPGSARRLVEALDAVKPACVLIEGPADATPLIPLLGEPGMVPPVALLAYPPDEPGHARFWPLARFSPEYQAALWTLRHGAACRFIDLPSAWRVPQAGEAEMPEDAPPPATEETNPLQRDPVGVLAKAAGYEDGESWWRDVIEENPEPGPVFAAVAEAMAVLREAAPPPKDREAAREAHMRLEIARARRETDGAVAVVCGAWHAPALAAKVPLSADRALLRDAPKRRMVATWAPWTSPRLAFDSGYGAGVVAPGWCAHLWDTPAAHASTRWLGRIAAALRAEGHLISTASIIEAQRLAVALAALRGRPAPGFEELREAALACLCFGEAAMWAQVARPLLVGNEVGSVAEGAPQAPLLEDLAREQRRLKLKPEALDRELALDLRSEAGLARSTLLHRLLLLDVPWGTLQDPGGSRGTFRERWILRWEPELAVRLVENLVFGPTIAQAAAGRLARRLQDAQSLGHAAELVLEGLTAQMPDAAAAGMALLDVRAAHTDDAGELLAALPPLANLLRYGQARQTDLGPAVGLFGRIAAQAAIGLPYAARNLDREAAASLRRTLRAADAALVLFEDAGTLQAWRGALAALVADAQASLLLAGTAARLLYEAGAMDAGAAATLLGRMLSPGRATAEAADFFDGFFDGGGERLIHDAALREAVDRWLVALDPVDFMEHLPLLRRVLSALDRMQRRRLLDAVLARNSGGLPGRVLAPDSDQAWARHFARLRGILAKEPG
ncbi:DUF5682 family protein [Falsiroseomonas sp. HW251]|uniref:DUF5682 family protein n=1 Tax=Falsiroseomonas sp. HW251 TaxID=3390998 RepID=UPI003D317300